MEETGLSHLDCEAGETWDALRDLEVYENLDREHGRYTSLLESAVAHGRSVREHIFEKVRKEYEAKKSRLEEEREKLGGLLRANLRTFFQEREELAGVSLEEQDLMEEIDFRVRVGEHTPEAVAEQRDELSRRLKRHAEELERIEEILCAYARTGICSASADPEDPSDPGEPDGTPNRHEPLETPPAEAPGWDLQKPITEDCCPADAEHPERSACRDREAGVPFQILAQDTDTSEETCPVVQCLDLSMENTWEEGGDTRDDARQGSLGDASRSHVTGYLKAVEGSRRGERFPLLCSNLTLGTSPGSDIRLSDPGIRNFHAQIHFKDRKHYLENLDAAGTCFLNGLQGDLMELKDGDIIRLGEVKFQVEFSDVN